MAKCWKCGREVDNYYVGLLETVCPECRTLDVLNRMEEKQREEEEERRKELEARREEEEERIEEQKRWKELARQQVESRKEWCVEHNVPVFELPGDKYSLEEEWKEAPRYLGKGREEWIALKEEGWKELARQQVESRKEWCVEHNVPVFELPGDKFVSEEYVIPPSAISTPKWWENAMHPKSSVSAGALAFLAGEWGIPFIYIGKGWAVLGVVIFAFFWTFMVAAANAGEGAGEKIGIFGICFLIYMFFTNILMAFWFCSMDDDDFLKRFRYDLWEEKQFASQYGHEIYPGTGKYTDIPVNKPSREEAFSAKQKDSTQEEQKASSTPSDDDASKPKVRLKIVK